VTTLGIDVSTHRGGSIAWSALAEAGVRFSFCKATEHLALRDETFERHADDAASAGLLVGSFHFFRPEVDPERQARHYHAVAHGRVVLPPVLDFENLRGVTPAEALRRAVAFVEATEALWGRTCVIHTYPSFWSSLGDPASPELGARPLWIAHHGADQPRLPSPWSRWQWWQFDANGRGRLPEGIETHVNWFAGTELELQRQARVDASTPRPSEDVPTADHAPDSFGEGDTLPYEQPPARDLMKTLFALGDVPRS
jgi:lysozyme